MKTGKKLVNAECTICRRKVQFIPCNHCRHQDDPRNICTATQGWWHLGKWLNTEQYNVLLFCSTGCLHKWVLKQLPQVNQLWIGG